MNDDHLIELLQTELKTIKLQYEKLYTEKSRIQNELLDYKGSIRVFARLRPSEPYEKTTDIDTLDDTTILSSGKTFCFDHVFGPSSTQEEVFKEVKPLASSLLDGFNCCLFAYGQTGSGKTYTMEGIPEDRGINFRIMKELLNKSVERHDVEYKFNMSIYEIYNEQITDLLGDDGPVHNLKVRIGKHGAYVSNATVKPVSDIHEMWSVIDGAKKFRSVATTDMNERSSRSHCITFLEVIGVNKTTSSITRSKLYLIDLAGSERASQTGARDKALSESKHINKSLSALSRVMESLSAKKSHIPYRDSVLTFLLQDSLSGKSRTCMFIQLSPEENSYTQTLCTLNFGVRVKKIELGPAQKNLEIDKKVINELKMCIENEKSKTKQVQDNLNEKVIEIEGLNLEVEKRNKAISSLRQELVDKKSLLTEHETIISNQSIEIEDLKEQLMIQSMKSASIQTKPAESRHIEVDLLTDFPPSQSKVSNTMEDSPLLSVPFTPVIKSRIERQKDTGSVIKKRPITKTFTRINFSSIQKQTKLKSSLVDKSSRLNSKKNVSFSKENERSDVPMRLKKSTTTPLKTTDVYKKFYSTDRFSNRISKFVKTPLKSTNL